MNLTSVDIQKIKEQFLHERGECDPAHCETCLRQDVEDGARNDHEHEMRRELTNQGGNDE